MKTIEILEKVTAELDKKMAIDIKIIDISKISDFADYFLICSANNPNQMKTLQDTAEETLVKCKVKTINVEGKKNWILIDCMDFIIHIFDKEDREFYNLEHMWQDGNDIDITPFLPKRDKQ